MHVPRIKDERVAHLFSVIYSIQEHGAVDLPDEDSDCELGDEDSEQDDGNGAEHEGGEEEAMDDDPVCEDVSEGGGMEKEADDAATSAKDEGTKKSPETPLLRRCRSKSNSSVDAHEGEDRQVNTAEKNYWRPHAEDDCVLVSEPAALVEKKRKRDRLMNLMGQISEAQKQQLMQFSCIYMTHELQ